MLLIRSWCEKVSSYLYGILCNEFSISETVLLAGGGGSLAHWCSGHLWPHCEYFAHLGDIKQGHLLSVVKPQRLRLCACSQTMPPQTVLGSLSSEHILMKLPCISSIPSLSHPYYLFRWRCCRVGMENRAQILQPAPTSLPPLPFLWSWVFNLPCPRASQGT